MKTILKNFFPILFVLFLFSCSNSFSNQSSIVVKMPNASTGRALFEGNDGPNISYFGVEVTQGDKLIAQEPAARPDDEVVFSNLVEGEYTVTVTAFIVVQEEDGTQNKIPFYKGSDTKFVKAGSVTSFLITLKKVNAEDDSTDDCPFYADPIQNTKFTKILTLNSMMVTKDAFEPLKDGEYYQLITTENTNSNEYGLVDGAIYRVTPKEGQEPDRTLLKDNLSLTFANYYCIALIEKTGDGVIPYIILTEYAQNNEELFETMLMEYAINSEVNGPTDFFDFVELYNKIQIDQYMPQVYKALWKNKDTLTKHDDAFDVDRLYYLHELSEDQLKKLNIARINLYYSEEDFSPTYAMAGNSVSLPNREGIAFYYDLDGTRKVDGSSITVEAGITNLYMGEDDGDGGNDDPLNSKADISGSYFENESKTITFTKISCYEGDSRFRANVDISDLFNKYTISTGDTVVFTISGKSDTAIPTIYWQFAEESNGVYKVYDDKYNSCSLVNNKISNNEQFSLPMPQNKIIIPGGAKYNTFQLYYGGNYGITIQDFKLSYRIYSAEKNVYECAKSCSDNGQWYNEFTVVLNKYEVFNGKTISGNGDYYFAVSAECDQNISFDEITLFKPDEIYNLETVGLNKNKSFNLGGQVWIYNEKQSEHNLQDCVIQFKIKTDETNKQNPLALFNFNITNGSGSW